MIEKGSIYKIVLFKEGPRRTPEEGICALEVVGMSIKTLDEAILESVQGVNISELARNTAEAGIELSEAKSVTTIPAPVFIPPYSAMRIPITAQEINLFYDNYYMNRNITKNRPTKR